jgi:hypothetical protein
LARQRSEAKLNSLKEQVLAAVQHRPTP